SSSCPACRIIYKEDTPSELHGFNTQAIQNLKTESNAITSSLWELKILQNNYLSNITALAKIFQDKFNKPSYNPEDFLDPEISEKPKKVPALAFEKPKFVFL
ncbi:16894_t:CDS:2, partial [Racocetra persica]